MTQVDLLSDTGEFGIGDIKARTVVVKVDGFIFQVLYKKGSYAFLNRKTSTGWEKVLSANPTQFATSDAVIRWLVKRAPNYIVHEPVRKVPWWIAKGYAEERKEELEMLRLARARKKLLEEEQNDV